jgi:hypothetical protein
MRMAQAHYSKEFDVFLAADNSVPYLLTDDDILSAFQESFQCTRPMGGGILTIRDSEKADLSKQQLKP